MGRTRLASRRVAASVAAWADPWGASVCSHLQWMAIRGERKEEKKEEVRTKREIDLYFIETLKQLSDRLSEIEKRHIDSSEKTEES